jgi:hypothetical protein
VRYRGEHRVSEARAAELRAQWFGALRAPVVADLDATSSLQYSRGMAISGHRILPMPGADAQARKMRR